LISRRGVGKTFSVLKELIKLSQLPDRGGYTQVLPVLYDLIDAKNAYEDI
jgi:hypothetical protein